MNTLLKITFTITMAVLGTNPALAQFGNKSIQKFFGIGG